MEASGPVVTPWPHCPVGTEVARRRAPHSPSCPFSGPLASRLRACPAPPAAGPHPMERPLAGEVWKLGSLRPSRWPLRPTHQQAQQLRPGGTPRAERGHGRSGGGSALMVTLRISYMVRAQPLPPRSASGTARCPPTRALQRGTCPQRRLYVQECRQGQAGASPPASARLLGLDVGSRPPVRRAGLTHGDPALAGPAPPDRPALPVLRERGGGRALETAPSAAGRSGPAGDGRAEAHPRADQAPVLVMGSRPAGTTRPGAPHWLPGTGGNCTCSGAAGAPRAEDLSRDRRRPGRGEGPPGLTARPRSPAASSAGGSSTGGTAGSRSRSRSSASLGPTAPGGTQR